LYINEFLPSEFVEDFFNIKTLVNKKINIPTKKILVGRSLWENTFKKFWVASQINEKKLLYLVEHGGGLPDKYYHFDYLINYSDKFLSWAKLKNKKSYQLPADKFMFKCQFSFFKKKKEKFIIIEPIFERYLQTLSSRSVSSLYHEHTQMINLFISNLNEDLKNRSYIKLSPINEIHTNKFYTLKNFTNYNWSIEKVITEAKLLICTYPMTTLSEVIMSSKPFILIYPENIYLRNFQQNNKVIKKMKKAKILFSDSEKAATHLNNISSNIEGWWNTNEVKESLKIYKKYCLGLHKSDFKNIKRWIEFLN
jgi:putative transferase (TIGR04331 family)